jgi:pilus assembly protein Flp/PilA
MPAQPPARRDLWSPILRTEILKPVQRGVEMTRLIPRIQRFLASEDGPTAVEYAVMLALIVVAIIVVVTQLGQTVSGTFSSVSSSLAGS